jgi:hypothetical protein
MPGDAQRIATLHREIAAAEYHAPDLVAELLAIPIQQAVNSWHATIARANSVVYALQRTAT